MNTNGFKDTQAPAGASRARSRALAFAALAAAFAGAPGLAGQETWSVYKYGFQLGALMPTGEKLTEVAETGFGAAAYLEKMWSNGWGLRGRVEYTYFGDKEITYEVKTSVTQTGGMLDVVYYSRSSPLYPFVGIGFFSRSGQRKVVGNSEKFEMSSSTAISVGGGWNITNHIGFEVKYSITESSWGQASLLYRF